MNERSVYKREIRTLQMVKVKCEKGGGMKYVEPKVSRSIEDMYARMLKTGELQEAQHVKCVNHGSFKQAVALMEAAKAAPKYMRDGELNKVLKNNEIIEEELRQKNKAKKRKDEVDVEVKRRMEKIV